MAESSTSVAASQPVDSENWDYLARATERKERMLEDIQKIHEACPKDPGHRKAPVKECKVCYRKIVDRIKHRYLDNPETEWYAGRRIFIQHLSDLCLAVKRGEADLSAIEDRVMNEKQKWFTENAKRFATTTAGFGLADKREELMRLLDDKKLGFPDFCQKVQDVIDLDIMACPPGALQRLTDTRLKKQERVQAYIEIFFFPEGKPGVVKESTRKYLDMLDQGLSMRQITARMMEDRRQSISHRAEIEEKKQRIEDLDKAKATWQKEQERKKEMKRTKKPAKPSQGPPCAVCGTPADEIEQRICPLCYISSSYDLGADTHVYCSEPCQVKDYLIHLDEKHGCAGDQNCIQIGDEADDLEDSQFTTLFCKVCLEASISFVYWCSLKCAVVNYHSHREQAHPDVDQPHRDYDAGQIQEGWNPKMAAWNETLVSLDQVMHSLEERDVITSYSLKESPNYTQQGANDIRTTAHPDAMEGVEIQHTPDNEDKLAMKGSGKTASQPEQPLLGGSRHDTEMTDFASTAAGQGEDTEMRDAGRVEANSYSHAGPEHGRPVSQRGSGSGAKEDKPTETNFGTSLFPPEYIERFVKRQSAEPPSSVEMQQALEKQHAKLAGLYPPKATNSTAMRPSPSTESGGALRSYPSTVEVANMGTGDILAERKVDGVRDPKETKDRVAGPGVPSNSRAEPVREYRKVAPSVETQHLGYRSSEQRRYGDREPARNDDFRKRKPEFMAPENRQYDREREFKRARSRGSEELEEGEI